MNGLIVCLQMGSLGTILLETRTCSKGCGKVIQMIAPRPATPDNPDYPVCDYEIICTKIPARIDTREMWEGGEEQRWDHENWY